MRDAIVSVESTHNIFFSLCNWGRDNVWTWGANYGNSWRMSVDVWNDWASIVRVGSAAAGIYQYSAPYGFNDLDMLQCGNGVLNDAECRTQFGIWAIAKSPLIIGTDISKVSSTVLGIFKNKLLISINQDSLGKAATYFRPSGSSAPVNGQLYPYWAGQLSDGVVVAFTNAGSGTTTYSTNFADVPGLGSGTWSWTEAYSGQTGSGTSLSASVGAHDTKVFKIVKSNGSTTGGNTPTVTPTSVTPTPTGSCSALYGQCGGLTWTGPKCCSSGTCKYSNDYYSQCL
jgi:alpha-galactosidase